MTTFGLGTGRCGTKSLAKDLGGRHEPKPWFGPEAIMAYWGNPVSRDQCRLRLLDRLRLGVPLVDLHFSLMIPLICEVDPYAEFIWMVREPESCIASLLAGGAWSDKNLDSQTLWRPRDGWPVDQGRLYKAVDYWCAVNKLIERDLRASGHAWELRFLEDLRAHENEYPKDRAWAFDTHNTQLIEDRCGSAWTRLRCLAVRRYQT